MSWGNIEHEKTYWKNIKRYPWENVNVESEALDKVAWDWRILFKVNEAK